MPRSGGACHVVDLVHFQKDWQRHIVTNQLEIGSFEQMDDVRFLAREKIVETDHIMAVVDQSFAEMRAEKTGTASNENPMNHDRRAPESEKGKTIDVQRT